MKRKKSSTFAYLGSREGTQLTENGEGGRRMQGYGKSRDSGLITKGKASPSLIFLKKKKKKAHRGTKKSFRIIIEKKAAIDRTLRVKKYGKGKGKRESPIPNF